MRIRSTKPEFWRSAKISELDWDTRLVLKALESYVDDNGVGKDSVVIFCADAFPHDLAKSPEICAKIARSLAQLAEAGIIVRYTVAGEPLIYVRRWKQWQYIDKPKAGRYPRPDGTLGYRDTVDESIGGGQGVTDKINREGYPKPPENFAKTSSGSPQIQSGDQGNRGTGEQTKTARDNDEPPLPEPPEDVADEILDAAPRFIENLSRPTPLKPTDAARTVVRTTLGTGYPKTTIDRLAVQVMKLTREGHPDLLIREALREWDHRVDCTKAEYLPTVLGDIVKRSRAAPATNGHDDKVNSYLAFANQPSAREIEA